MQEPGESSVSGKDPVRECRSAFAVYASAVLAYALLAAILKATRAGFCWPITFPASLLLLRSRETAAQFFLIGLIHGAVVLWPLIFFVPTKQARWLLLECALLAAGPIAFVVFMVLFGLFIGMPAQD